MTWYIRSTNRPMFDKCMKTVREELTDVNFIFESNGINNDNNATGPPAKKIARRGKSTVGGDVVNVIKISANKKILAASSPVFNTMFNGPLKETGNVKIVDVSPDAFREFLQMFYEPDVKLTMENLGEVMKLIDKYDVEAVWPIVELGIKQCTVDDILWGLNLAVRFRRDNLITHCMNVIERNIAKVFDMIEFDDSGKPKLRLNPNNRLMIDTDLTSIYSRIHTAIKKYISESVPVKVAGVVSLKLQRWMGTNISNMQDISFSTNRRLLLTRISCAGFSSFGNYGRHSLPYDVKVNIAGTETCHKISWSNDSIKYESPVLIQANCKYTIQTTIVTKFPPEVTFHGHKIPTEAVHMAPDIQITFDNAHSNSIVTGLNFLRYDQ